MLVDDSAVVRQVLMSILQGVADIEVIGVASDPIFAMEKLNREWPDVIVLDVEMPRMDGITFLKKNHGRAADAGSDLFDADGKGGGDHTPGAVARCSGYYY